MTLDTLYGALASARRRWYDQRPDRRVRAERPVISVGALTAGGSGKTPLVAAVTRVLLEMGERPAILSRGYARTDPRDGVTVVRDARGIVSDLGRSGDEPLMLARALDGAAVLVSADRALAARLAERRLACTVHVLDDGFQHLPLARDIDLLAATPEDLESPRLLPVGRLRERIETARLADALIFATEQDEEAERARQHLGVRRVFRAMRRLGSARSVDGAVLDASASGAGALAFAGIARPGGFFESLRRAGWRIVQEMAFADHHPYTARDVETLGRAARSSGAEWLITTEKDLMRLLPLRPLPGRFAWIPLAASIEPADPFRAWLVQELARARSGKSTRASMASPVRA